MTYVGLWVRAFAVTLGSELLIAPRLLPSRESRRRRLGAVVAANVLSHPAVWFVFPDLGLRYGSMLVLAELWAFGSEALLYALVFVGLSWRRALGVSAVANALSLGLGLLLRGAGFTL
ncbi:MAG: hypothetical protein IPI67_29020 [Myxococcales bacterium]|nr:hypothetical protein [Myxococcales bacterium]